jgi:hypothetical protein
MVRVVCANLGRVVTPSELDDFGLLAPEEKPVILATPTRYRSNVKPYSHYLAAAPPRNKDKQPDRSRADQAFVNQLIGAGWCDENIIAELMKESERAKEKGIAYVLLTVKNGHKHCDERRRQRSRRKHTDWQTKTIRFIGNSLGCLWF